MNKQLGILLSILMGSSSVIMADQVTLKNGDRVTGKIVTSDGSNLVIKSDLIGDVNVPLTAIETFNGDTPVSITLADGRVLSGVFTIQNEKAQVQTANSTAVSIDRSSIKVIRSPEEQLAYEQSLDPGWFEGWSGGLDFGLAFTSGNSDTTNMALGLAMARETTRDKTSAYAAAIYNRDRTSGESRTVADTVRFGIRYDRDINKRWFGYGFSDLEHNGLQDLNLRVVLGGGIGYHMIRSERTQLDLLGGLAWNKEFFSGDFNDRSSAEAQFGQTLSHRLGKRTTLKEQLFVFPNLSRGGEFRINFDSTLVTDITRRIGWQITVSDRYLSDPPFGLEKNDLLITTGIKVKLGTLK